MLNVARPPSSTRRHAHSDPVRIAVCDALLILILAASSGLALASEAEGPEHPLVATTPSDPQIPPLSVFRDDEQVLVAAQFPSVAGFVADSWCYESQVEFVNARTLSGDRIELRHALPTHPGVELVTVVSPEADAVEFVARWEVDASSEAGLPDDVPTPNLCWQLKRAAGFQSKPDPYPEFIQRCFIFTK